MALAWRKPFLAAFADHVALEMNSKVIRKISPRGSHKFHSQLTRCNGKLRNSPCLIDIGCHPTPKVAHPWIGCIDREQGCDAASPCDDDDRTSSFEQAFCSIDDAVGIIHCGERGAGRS